MLFNTIFIISVAVVGFVEWLKNLLPAKVKDSKIGVPIISGIISAAVGVGFVFAANPLFGLEVELNLTNFLIYSLGTVGTVQICYNVLLQTFKAVVAKLKNKYTMPEINTEEKADQIVDAIDSKITEAVNKALENAKK